MGNVALCCEKKRQLDAYSREITSLQSTSGKKKKTKKGVARSASSVTGSVIVIDTPNNTSVCSSTAKTTTRSSKPTTPTPVWDDKEILSWAAAVSDDELETDREQSSVSEVVDEDGWVKCAPVKSMKKAAKSPASVESIVPRDSVPNKGSVPPNSVPPKASPKAEQKRPKAPVPKDKPVKKSPSRPTPTAAPAPRGILGRSDGSPDWTLADDEPSRPFRPVEDKSRRRKPKLRHAEDADSAPRSRPAPQASAPKPKPADAAPKPSRPTPQATTVAPKPSSAPLVSPRWADVEDDPLPQPQPAAPPVRPPAPRAAPRAEPRQPSPAQAAPPRPTKPVVAVPAAPQSSQWTRPPASVVEARAKAPSPPAQQPRGKKGKHTVARTVVANAACNVPVIHAQPVTRAVKLSRDAAPFVPSAASAASSPFPSPFQPAMRIISARNVSDDDSPTPLSAPVATLRVPAFSPSSSTSSAPPHRASPAVEALSPRSPVMRPILSAVLTPAELETLEEAIRREEQAEQREREIRQKLDELRRKRGGADNTGLSAASTVLDAETPERMSSLSLGEEALPASLTI